MSSSLLVVDCEAIRKLKQDGLWWEADKLIRVHQYSLLLNRKQTKREIVNLDQRKKNFKRRKEEK